MFKLFSELDVKKYEDQPDYYRLFYEFYREGETIFKNLQNDNDDTNQKEIYLMKSEIDQYLEDIKFID